MRRPCVAPTLEVSLHSKAIPITIEYSVFLRRYCHLTEATLAMTILDKCEIRSLLTRERFARDTGQFKKLREAYHPDASKTRIHIMW